MLDSSRQYKRLRILRLAQPEIRERLNKSQRTCCTTGAPQVVAVSAERNAVKSMIGCGSRFCPVCGPRYRAEMAQELKNGLQAVHEGGLNSFKFRAVLVTATIPHRLQTPIEEQVNALVAGLNSLTQKTKTVFWTQTAKDAASKLCKLERRAEGTEEERASLVMEQICYGLPLMSRVEFSAGIKNGIHGHVHAMLLLPEHLNSEKIEKVTYKDEVKFFLPRVEKILRNAWMKAVDSTKYSEPWSDSVDPRVVLQAQLWGGDLGSLAAYWSGLGDEVAGTSKDSALESYLDRGEFWVDYYSRVVQACAGKRLIRCTRGLRELLRELGKPFAEKEESDKIKNGTDKQPLVAEIGNKAFQQLLRAKNDDAATHLLEEIHTLRGEMLRINWENFWHKSPFPDYANDIYIYPTVTEDGSTEGVVWFGELDNATWQENRLFEPFPSQLAFSICQQQKRLPETDE